MATSDGPNISSDELVLCLDPADINSYPGSGTTLFDMAGNNYDAALQGGASYSGGNIVLNGTTDYLEVTDTADLDGTTEKTICIWLKLDAYTSPGSIFCKRSDTTNNDYFIFLWTGNTVWWDQGAGSRINTGYVPPLNTWLNLCFVKNASARILYINGAAYNSYSAGAVTTTISNLFIGRNALSGSFYLDGTLGPIQIYNRALSAAEILHNFNATRKRYNV